MKLTIEELAKEVNKQLTNISSDDKRFSNHVSARRIRDYVSKGVLDKPFKDGKNIYFTELHYQKLIGLREIQSEGISDESIRKMISSENKSQERNSLKDSAVSTINEIMSKNNSLEAAASSLTNSGIGYLNSFIGNNHIAKSKEAKTYMNKSISKSWVEIALLDNNKAFFRMETGANFSEEDKKEILKNIKQILCIQGEKND